MNRQGPLIAITCAALGSGCSSTPVVPAASDVPLADLVDLPPTDTGTDVAADVLADVVADTGTDADPLSDAGLTCGQARGDGTVTGCAPASVVLDPAICRCILGYYWDGRACASSANCHCFSRCEQLYPSREACVAAYARCG